jgi:hypothetical protein
MDNAYKRSEEELESDKMAMLAELKRICPNSKEWTDSRITLQSTHAVISMELNIQRQNVDEDQKVFFARLILGAACYGTEAGGGWVYRKFNGKFLDLEGWAMSVMADTAQYDPILRRCYRQLFPQGIGSSSPFVDLAIALGLSAIMFGLINRGQNQVPAQGAATTTVPSSANSFMDQNAPTPAQTRLAPKPSGGGGFMDVMMKSMGGGEGGGGGMMQNIMKMVQGGGLGNMMNQMGMGNMASQEPPSQPFQASGAPFGPTEPSQPTGPVDQMREEARGAQHAHHDEYSEPVRPRSRASRKRSSQSSRRSPSPPFDERTGRFEAQRRAPRSPRGPQVPVFGETSPPSPSMDMEGPDEDESHFETSSMQTMDCDSDDDVPQMD